MRFVLPSLPYATNALEPYISEKTMELHYKGHLKGYVDKLNRLPVIANSKEKLKLEEVIIRGRQDYVDNRSGVLPPGEQASTLYNLSGQVYNHVFYFRSLAPNGGGEPDGAIGDIITAQYGTYANFRRRLIARGENLFGSGWVWIVLDENDNLELIRGLDAETPIAYKGLFPLLCIDVWEHAYYADYEYKRKEYLEALVDNLLNWNFANQALAQ